VKKLPVLFGMIVAIIVAGTAFAEVEVKEAPLTWQQAALTDGEGLYLELCTVCHGSGGKGDGPAATAMTKPVPDLTVLAAKNEGKFPREAVEDSIAGESRVVSHGTIDMPIWGQVFEDAARTDWKAYRREGQAKQRIYDLTEYLETLQVEYAQP
jgi:mono/diheme cytochrome c family protein